MDTRGSKGERETKNLSEKDCRKSWNLAKATARDKKGGGGVGRTMWWPYAPSGEMSDDDDGQIDASPKLLWLSKGASSYVVSSRVKADIRGAWGDCLARSLRDSALASLSSRVTG